MRNTLLPFLFLILISCEDIITPELPTNDPILVVDAWLNNLNEEQKIILSLSLRAQLIAWHHSRLLFIKILKLKKDT